MTLTDRPSVDRANLTRLLDRERATHVERTDVWGSALMVEGRPQGAPRDVVLGRVVRCV